MIGFEAVTSIIFCVALSEYDQVLLEENGQVSSPFSRTHDSTNDQNRMQESLVLFESVINSRWFLRTSVILFLNKIDVFKQKLPKVPLVHYFPEYTGGSDINKAAKYILWRFTQTNRARLSVYPHLTQATDTSNVCPFPFFSSPSSSHFHVCIFIFSSFGVEMLTTRSDWYSQQSKRLFYKTPFGTVVSYNPEYPPTDQILLHQRPTFIAK